MYLILCLYRVWRENRALPPGPNGLPFVGYLPYINGDFHEELTSLSRKHGPVFSLRLGSELMVVLSDHRIIREAFRREEFAFRPDNEFMKLLDGYGKWLPFFNSPLSKYVLCFGNRPDRSMNHSSRVHQ